MINTTLATGREEIHYSTVDLSVFDLYSGECEIVKAGASSTFIKKKRLCGASKFYESADRGCPSYRD